MGLVDTDFPILPRHVSGFDDPLIQFKEYLNRAMSVRALQTYEKHNLSFIPTKNFESVEDLAVSAAFDLRSKNYHLPAFKYLDKYAPDFVMNKEFAFYFMAHTFNDLIKLYESGASRDLTDEKELELSYVESKYFPAKFMMKTSSGDVHYKSVLFAYQAARFFDTYNAQINDALKEKKQVIDSGSLDALNSVNENIEELERIRFL